MKLRTHRLRRIAAAAALGVGALGGMGVFGLVGTGTAGAAPATNTTGTIATTTTPPTGVARTSTTSGANLKVTISGGAATFTLELCVSTAAGYTTGEHVTWHTPSGHDTITSSGLSATGWSTTTSPHDGGACISTTVTKSGSGTATLTVAAPYFVSKTATGYALVTPYIDGSHSYFPLTTKRGGSAIDMYYATATPTTVAYAHLKNETTPIPPAPLGATSAKAGQWKLAVGKTTGQGWVKGDQIFVYVGASHGSTAFVCTGTNYLLFAKTPKITAVTTFGTLSTPLTKTSFTVSVTHTSGLGCNATENDVMVITMKTTEKFNGRAGAEIYFTTIAYSVGATDVTGTITVTASWYTATATHIKTVTVDTASNAIVSAAYVTVTPVVNLKPASVDQSIGTVTLNTVGPTIAPTATPTSGKPAWVCFYTEGGGLFNTTASAKASAKGTGAKVTPTVHYFQIEKSGLATGVSFKITNDGTTGPQAFSVTGLKVNATYEGNATVVVYMYYADTATCGSSAGAPTDTAAVLYTTSPRPAYVISGATADGTAAAELNTAFPGGCPAVVKGTTSTLQGFAGIVQRNVVLARDTFFSDALASQYLAGFLGTGTLLTPKTHLSTVTLNAIKNAGISHVYVIGGSFAISTTIVAQLQTTEVYNCGGTAVQKNIIGQPVFLQVTRIAGPTAAGTAQAIAQFAGRNYVGSLQAQGAYRPNATNKMGGSGFFNLTAGKGSTSPSTYLPLRTAILSTTHSWQDAESAAVLSYTGNLTSCTTDGNGAKPAVKPGGCTTGFPMLLSTPTSLPAATKSAIQNLGIQQVIVMGGPYAVSNTVVTALQGLGVSVFRVAGQTYTSTAVELAKFEEATNTFLGGFYGLDWQYQQYSHEGGTLGVARGDFYTDGLAGADVAYNGGNPFPIVLTVNPTTVGSTLTAFLKGAGLSGTGVNGTHHHRVGTLVIFGGPAAVTPAVITQMTSDVA